MGFYYYKAIDSAGKTVKSYYQATSQEEVSLFLLQRNYTPISIKLSFLPGWLLTKRWMLFLPLTKNAALYFLLEFTNMLKSHMPVSAILESLEHHSPNRRIRYLAVLLKRDLLAGESIWEALAKYRFFLRNVFPIGFSSTQKLGKITVIFEQIYSIQSAKQSSTKRILMERLPQIVTFFFVSSVTVYFGYDIFTFHINDIAMFPDKTVPEFYLAVYAAVSWLYFNWYFLISAIFATWLAFLLAYRVRLLKLFFDYVSLWLYPLSKLIRAVHMNVFLNQLYLYLTWGMPIQSALLQASSMVDNLAIKNRAKKFLLFIEKGLSMQEAATKSRLFSWWQLQLFSIPSREQLLHALKEAVDNNKHQVEMMAVILSQILRIIFYVVNAFILIVFIYTWSALVFINRM